MYDSISLRQSAAPHGADALVSFADGIELPEEESKPLEAKLAQLEASSQKLRFENLELRLRLQRRRSRWAFERKLLVIGGLGLLVLGLVVGLFLGLVVVGYIRQTG